MPKRSSTPFVLGLVAIAAVIPLAWWLFLREPSPPPLPPKPPTAAKVDAGAPSHELKLAEISGTVEVRRGLDGGWEPAAPGTRLSPSDGVRTTNGSYAVLVGEEYWEVKMEPGTEVGIGELSDSISRLLLEKGMARAKVKGAGRHTFEVRAAQSDAVASTDGGVFTMATNGQGTVAVGAESGEVVFGGGGRVVIVRAGQQSLMKPGQAPSEPEPIPSSLLLKVALPGRSTLNTPKVLVKGTAAAGAMVEVQGAVVQADEQGRFETAVTLKEGKNRVQVKARGVGGNGAQSTHDLELDTTVKAPTIDKNLWK
ncbi:MAG: FecR domain-containing protein [Myxococcales bacterium]|nr:FecR domain-containing protein [Myxococcales bacterium]